MQANDVSKLFKAYDIRGIVPDELEPDLAYKIGRAAALYLNATQIAVGRDMRVSSPTLASGLIQGLRDQGADVTDIGLISTDGLYFAVGKFGFDGGVMITASHNPPEYNGFKLCGREARALSMDQGIGEIRDLVLEDNFPDPEKPGDLIERDVTEDFIEHALSMIDVDVLKPLTVVVDAGNGMGGKVIPTVFERIPCKLIPLFFELDGTFPNHLANPLEPENVEDLKREVVARGADLGAAFDGDADRMFLIDDRGEFVDGTMVTAMVSKVMLEKHPGSAIVYNLINSRTVPEIIEHGGGKPIRARVGHSFIKALMREHDAVFGGEHSGHFYFRDNWYADSGLIALLTVLELLSKEGKSLREVLDPLDKRFRSGELNFEVRNQDAVVARVREAFSDADIDELDGLTVEYADWWFNVRASNTQPLLRLNVEADTPTLLERGISRVRRVIQTENS